MLRRNNGQSILEYAILLGVIIAALLIIQVFIKRGYQGGLKDSADKMGEQFSAGGTTIHQKRSMTTGDNQTITEYVATDANMQRFVPSAKNVANEGVYSYTTRTSGAVTATTHTNTDSADLEKIKSTDY